MNEHGSWQVTRCCHNTRHATLSKSSKKILFLNVCKEFLNKSHMAWWHPRSTVFDHAKSTEQQLFSQPFLKHSWEDRVHITVDDCPSKSNLAVCKSKYWYNLRTLLPFIKLWEIFKNIFLLCSYRNIFQVIHCWHAVSNLFRAWSELM